MSKCIECGRDCEGSGDLPREMHLVRNIHGNGCLRIIKTPEGEAPLHIRQAWVGIEIRACDFIARCCGTHGVLSGDVVPPRNSYLVSQAVAIDVLAARNPSAADWWRGAGFPKKDHCFAFRTEEVEPASPRF